MPKQGGDSRTVSNRPKEMWALCLDWTICYWGAIWRSAMLDARDSGGPLLKMDYRKCLAGRNDYLMTLEAVKNREPWPKSAEAKITTKKHFFARKKDK